MFTIVFYFIIPLIILLNSPAGKAHRVKNRNFASAQQAVAQLQNVSCRRAASSFLNVLNEYWIPSAKGGYDKNDGLATACQAE